MQPPTIEKGNTQCMILIYRDAKLVHMYFLIFFFFLILKASNRRCSLEKNGRDGMEQMQLIVHSARNDFFGIKLFYNCA